MQPMTIVSTQIISLTGLRISGHILSARIVKFLSSFDIQGTQFRISGTITIVHYRPIVPWSQLTVRPSTLLQGCTCRRRVVTVLFVGEANRVAEFVDGDPSDPNIFRSLLAARVKVL